jgi:hypothetical protein
MLAATERQLETAGQQVGMVAHPEVAIPGMNPHPTVTDKHSVVLHNRSSKTFGADWTVITMGEGDFKRDSLKVAVNRVFDVSVEARVPDTFAPNAEKDPRHDVLIIAPIVVRVVDATTKVNLHDGHVG